ncbi:hypothetical protein D3C80_881020 [compost metagenome]
MTIWLVVVLQFKAVPLSSNCKAKVEFVLPQFLLNNVTTVPFGLMICIVRSENLACVTLTETLTSETDPEEAGTETVLFTFTLSPVEYPPPKL